MTHSLVDIYNLTSFNEYNDYHRIKFIISKEKTKINIYVNDINYNYKPSKKIFEARAYQDYFLDDILEQFNKQIHNSNLIVKIKTNMNSKMININQSKNVNIIYNNKIFYSNRYMEIRFYKLNIKRFLEKNDTELYIELYIKKGSEHIFDHHYTSQSLITEYITIELRKYTQLFRIPFEYYKDSPTKFSQKKLHTFVIPIYVDNKLKYKHSLVVDYFHINKYDNGIYIYNSFINEITGKIISLIQKNHCNCFDRSYVKTSKIKDNTNIQDAISMCYCFYEKHNLYSEFNQLYMKFDDIQKILNLKELCVIEFNSL
jgi:hypothetical protein